MTLPVKVQQLCNQYLEKMRQDKKHHLLPFDRFTIYQAFGPSNHLADPLEGSTGLTKKESKYNSINFSKADLAFGWLAVITARKIMPIWLEAKIYERPDEEYYSCNPVEMLEEVEGVLLGKIPQEKAYWDLCLRFYDGSSGLEYSVTEKAYAAHSAAFAALEVVLCGVEELYYHVSIKSDDHISYSLHDFATMAARAYAAIDENEPGAWVKVRGEKHPLTIDLKKRLDFWEWWLLEAIPQAWELVSQSKPQTSY